MSIGVIDIQELSVNLGIVDIDKVSPGYWNSSYS